MSATYPDPALANRNALVFELLHKARSARRGAEEAHLAGDVSAEASLYQKARDKERLAEEADPLHECPAWATHQRGTH